MNYSYSTLRSSGLGAEKGILSLFSNKVLIFKIGHIPEEKFQFFLTALEQAGHCVDVHDLATGIIRRLYFDFLGGDQLSTDWDQFYLHTTWDPYYVHQRIVAAICICHCPSSPDLDVSFREFDSLKKRLQVPGGPAHVRCFAFEPMESQEDHRSRLDFVLVPPNENIERVKGYLGTLIEDLGSRLLADFHKYMRSYERMGLILKTPLETDTNTMKQAKLQKGRHSKHLGDLCLLIGNSKEAATYYQAAQDLTRVNGDWLWYAGALQGFAAYLVLIEEGNDTPKYCDKMDLLYSRILEAFARVPDSFFLSIDAVFHLARYAAKFKQYRLVTKTLEEVSKLRAGCGDHDQIALLLDAADICMQIGFHRKFAFYLNEAEWLYENLLQFSSAYALLGVVAPIYRLDHIGNIVAPKGFPSSTPPPPDPLLPNSPLPPRGWSRARLVENGYAVGRWVVLQKYILERLMANAKYHTDKALSASSCAYMLRSLQPHLDRETQKSLAADLWSITANLPLNTSIDMTGMPMLLRIVPVVNEDQGLVVHGGSTVAADQEGDGTVFLFSPEENDANGGLKKMIFVADETLEVDVYLSNPFLFELVIQRIALSTSGIHFEPFPRSLTLPPRSVDMQVRLSGKPMSAGCLQLRGVHIRAFNLTCEHLVDGVGCGLPTLRSGHPTDYRYMGFDVAPITEITPKIYPSRYPYSDPSKLATTDKRINCRDCQVLARLPRLVVRHSFHGADRALLVGEERTIELFFENTGTLPIGFLKIEVTDQYALNSAERQAAYYTEEETFLIEQNIAKKKQQRMDAAALLEKQEDSEDESDIDEEDEMLMEQRISSGGCNGSTNSKSVGVSSNSNGGSTGSCDNSTSGSSDKSSSSSSSGSCSRSSDLTLSSSSLCSTSSSSSCTPPSSSSVDTVLSASSLSSTTTTSKTTPVTSDTITITTTLSPSTITPHITTTTTTTTTITSTLDPTHLLEEKMERTPSRPTLFIDSHNTTTDDNKLEVLEERLMSVHFTRLNCETTSVTQPSLLPGQSLRVPIDILGLDSCKSAIVSVIYAELSSASLQRSVKETVAWEVRPCLELKSLRALPPKTKEGRQECQLLLEIQNSAATSFTLWCQLDGKLYQQTTAVEQNRVVRVSLPLDCMYFGSSSSHLRKLPSTPAALALSNQILARCRAEFLKRVKLKWESADQRKGFLVITDAHLTRELLVTLLPPPFVFNYSLPEECLVWDTPLAPLREDPQYRMLLGSFRRLNISVTNSTREPHGLDLSVVPYQDLNGRQDVDLGHKMLIVGSLQTSWPLLLPGQTISYDLNICFLSPGRFGFQFSVQYQEIVEPTLLKQPPVRRSLSGRDGFGSVQSRGHEAKIEEDRLSYVAPSPLIVDAVVTCT